MRELSLFQTGAPELVLHMGPLKELDGRYCTRATTQKPQFSSEPKARTPLPDSEYLVGVHGARTLNDRLDGGRR